MSPSLDDLRYIAEVEFADLLLGSQPLGEKLRLFLTDDSYIDLWLSRKLTGRFAYHWERQHLDGTLYRYDNFPDPAWSAGATFPRHFHNGSQDTVEAALFSDDLLMGFRDFMQFVKTKI